MESNLFIELSTEQQEVVAGGFVFDTSSFYNSSYKSLSKYTNFGGYSSSNAYGTSTNGNYSSSLNKYSNYLSNGGGTTIIDH